MEKKEALRLFEETGALQNGHFLLTSGLHSPQYFQCALVLQYPEYLQKFCEEIVDFYAEEDRIDVVMAPAIGGIVVAQEIARQTGARAIFAEREDRKMKLRRGFHIEPHEKVIVCEDVMTTGGSVKEILNIVDEAKGYPVGIGVVVDRSGGSKIDFDVPLFPVIQIHTVTYNPDKCPLCREKIPLVKMGSRDLT